LATQRARCDPDLRSDEVRKFNEIENLLVRVFRDTQSGTSPNTMLSGITHSRPIRSQALRWYQEAARGGLKQVAPGMQSVQQRSTMRRNTETEICV